MARSTNVPSMRDAYGRPIGGPAHVRVTQIERDQVAERLQTAFADGCLDQEEFDRRLHLAMTGRTHGDLGPLLGDLPYTGAPATHPGPVARASISDRVWSAGGHLLTYSTLFIAPLVVLLTQGQRSLFVRQHAAESLNFQLTFLLANVAATLVTVLTLGLFAWSFLVLGVAWFVFIVIGTVNAASGVPYRYPVNIRFVK